MVELYKMVSMGSRLHISVLIQQHQQVDKCCSLRNSWTQTEIVSVLSVMSQLLLLLQLLGACKLTLLILS